MSKMMRPVVGGEMRATKAAYVVLDGMNRKIKSGYIVTASVYRQMYTGEITISHTGGYSKASLVVDGVEYNIYTITSSGVLTVEGSKVKYWMCGGGSGGDDATASAGTYYSGYGGNGGKATDGYIGIGEHAIIIGAGGGADATGGATSIGDISVAGGSAESGGSGGGAGGWKRTGSTGSNSMTGHEGDGIRKYPFGASALQPHCAGGGGGGLYHSYTYCSGGAGGSNGSDGADSSNDTASSVGGDGGSVGGGAGGNGGASDSTYGNGGDASFYGAGGGGGGMYYSNSNVYLHDGGSGYQGVVYILIPKEYDKSQAYYSVTAGGAMNVNRCFSIDGTKYTKATTQNVLEGTNVTVYMYGPEERIIYENGTVVASSTSSGVLTYVFAMTANTSITFAACTVSITY